MTELAPLELGSVPEAFVRGRIGPGWDATYPLRGALGRLHFEEGSWWTWAPLGAEIHASAFEEGLPVGMGQDQAQDQAAAFISDYLAQGDRMALLEDFEASPTDTWLSKKQPPDERLACGNRLYWYATAPGMVAPMMQWGRGLFCCVVLAPSGLPVSPGGAISGDQIRTLGAAAQHFLIDAFDFEGYVVWSRSAS
jgi:hypothetical protein